MTAFHIAEPRCSAIQNWHPGFLTHVMPAVETVARRRFRSLPPSEREEATAEAVAGAVVVFVRLIRRGKDPATFARRLATFAVLRVLSGRLTGSADTSTDAMSRLARQRRGFTVESIDSGTNRNRTGWQELLAENETCTPADLAASRLDFAEWLGRMHVRRRQIAEALAVGYRTEEVAELFRISSGRVSQLRRAFEDSWREFQREAPRPAVAGYSER